MKSFYFFLISICFYGGAFAQIEGVSKIYAYKQKLKLGTVRVDESGREVPRKPQYNYFIYLASTTSVKPIEIWINGEAYVPTVSKVTVTPVEYTNAFDPNQSKILVPKIGKNVLQLSPSLTKINKPSLKGKTLSEKNELVIIYQGSGKIDKPYYKVVSKLTELDPVDMQ
ncbi:MAG: hypothetical protein J7502_11305 [Flavisolibacter sp.]|nr:hypothetical protein [Flavisolibacter sp.]